MGVIFCNATPQEITVHPAILAAARFTPKRASLAVVVCSFHIQVWFISFIQEYFFNILTVLFDTMEPQLLVNEGLSEIVAQRVSEIFSHGLLSPEELDDRAFEALREFDQKGALEVLDQFANSDLSHVQNKSAFLCGVMKTYVTKSSTSEPASNEAPSRADEGKIKALLERTGYTLDITSGQRKYGGPPPGWEGPVPGTGGIDVSKLI